MRFNIRIDAIWRWALWPGGATSQNSYVILGDDGMHFRFGLLFNRTIPYDQVAAVFPRSWPFLYGIGWRSNLRGVIGLTGSYHDVVEVRMKQRIGNWAAVFPVDRIAVSLEEPEAFIAELSARTGLAEPPDASALAKPRRRPTKRTADSGQQTAKAAAPKASRSNAAPATSNGRAKAARPATPKAQASAPPQAPAAPRRAPAAKAAKAATPKRAVRKAAPSRTAVRARRSRRSP
jgi:hypothetical protein